MQDREQLDLSMDTAKISMQLGFVASNLKPKTILALELNDINDYVSLLLNADENSVITAIDCSLDTYEQVKDLFAKYDVVPRLNFYSGEPDEILPWLEGKFDLIVDEFGLEMDVLKAYTNQKGYIAIKEDVCDPCEIEGLTIKKIENVQDYMIFAV